MGDNLIYNHLSDSYNQLFAENIIQFQKNYNTLEGKKSKKNYAVFYPSFGIRKNEQCQFLIYGQAVNGWGSEFNMSDKEPEIRNERLKKCIEYSNSYLGEKNHCPLDWVNVQWSNSTLRENIIDEASKKFYKDLARKYRTSRSFFWNVAYKLINDYYSLGRESWVWSQKMVWSNLYKIASQQMNPNSDERRFQEDLSIELVKKEIEELKPKFCIVLTNENWWKLFREKLKTTQLVNLSKPQVISFEQYNETKIVLTTRPFLGSSNKHVSQILNLIGNNH